MASMRMCTGCDRPNGPHFPRCMTCGEWLGVLSPEDGGPRSAQDGAMRARRLLEGLTPPRRTLLPAEFLKSVQIQASGRMEEPFEDAVTEPKMAAVALDDVAVVSAPEWIPGEISLDLESAFFNEDARDLLEPDDEWDSVDRLDGLVFDPASEARDLPAWGGVSSYRQQPPEGAPDEGPAEDYVDDRTSAPGLAALDLHTGPEMSALPPGSLPLVEVLSRGRGPFGPRDASMRLLLLPDPSYKDRSGQLKHRLKAILDIDLYTGVLFLHRRIPTHLAAGADVPQLRDSANQLRQAGLRVLLVDRDRWLDGCLPRRVVAISGRRPGPIVVTTAAGLHYTVERNTVQGAVFGDVPSDEETGAAGFWMLDLLIWREHAPLRIRGDEVDLDFLGDGNFAAPRTIARNLVRWLSEDAERPAPIDENFRHVPASARSVRSPHPEVHPIEGDFTEYVLLYHRARRV